MREKLLKTVMEFEAIIVPDIGRITFLGTPQTEESIYNALREKGYEVRIWPARVPRKDIYGGALAPMVAAMVDDPNLIWKPTDPQRFSDTDLLERELAYGKSDFALQFMLDTSLSDQMKYPLKLSDLIITNLGVDKASLSYQYGSSKEQQLLDVVCVGFSGDRFYRPMYYDKEKFVEYEGKVMAIDPSGRGNDEIGYAVVNQRHGNLFLMDCDGLKGGYEDANLVKLAKVAAHYKVNKVIIESNFGDGMFTKIFQPILQKYHRCLIEEVRHSTQKEKRIIDTLEPIMNQHRLIVDERVVRKDEVQAQADKNFSLFYQMTRICKERGALRHDDRLDSLAMAVAYWVESMARDEVSAAEEYHKAELERELEEFIMNQVLRGGVGGIGGQGPTKGTYRINSNSWVHIAR